MGSFWVDFGSWQGDFGVPLGGFGVPFVWNLGPGRGRFWVLVGVDFGSW